MRTLDPSSFDPELTLVLACLRWPPSEADRMEIRSRANRSIDWERFLEWAERHGVTPLVHRTLRQAAAPDVPAAVHDRLRQAGASNTRRVLRQIAESRRITGLLAEAGIRSMMIKGPVLAVLAYSDPVLRLSRDVDLLVDPERALEADRSILAAGYRRDDPDFELNPHQLDLYRRIRCQFGYRTEGFGTRIELHWRLTSNPMLLPLRTDALWRRPTAVAVAGTEFATLADGDLFLYLCVHGSTHAWFRLKWLADIGALLRRMQGDALAGIAAHARALGVERPFHQALILAARLLQAPVSAALEVEAESDAAAGHLSASAYKAIAWHGSPSEPAATRWFNAWIGWKAYRLKPGLRYRWLEFLGQVHAPEDWARFPLPRPLFFLYLPLRPVSWAVRKLRALVWAGG